jgi:hypothetical protein
MLLTFHYHDQGTSSEQDNRFSDKEKKLLKQMKFADNLVKKVCVFNLRKRMIHRLTRKPRLLLIRFTFCVCE